MRRSNHDRSDADSNVSQPQGVKIVTTLGYNAYADILASTISTLDTPATIGIFAGWGCGKSYLMQKIKEILNRRSSKYPATNGALSMCFWLAIRLMFFIPPKAILESEEIRFISVYFNALEYAGSDHLWAGLVTKLVNSVECGVGRLPSAIFRANAPNTRHLAKHMRTKISNDKSKTKFKPKMICGKIPLYVVALIVFVGCLASSTYLIVFTIIKRDKNMADYEKENNGTIPEDTLTDAEVRRNISVGAIFLSVPVVVVCRNTLSIVFKLVNSHASQIKKIFSKPDFSKELGVMAKIKHEIKHLSLLVRFMELFEQRRTVVVIFIDDLDKIPPQNIAPLLQTIKILLSDPNRRFVSVIAMEPNSVSDALEMGIQSEFPALNISGHKFLKQMIQVPFTIPSMSYSEKKKLLKMLRKSNKVPEIDDSDGENLTEDEADSCSTRSRRKVKKKKRRLLLASFDRNHEVVEMDDVVDGRTSHLVGDVIGHQRQIFDLRTASTESVDAKSLEMPLHKQESVASACDSVLRKLMDTNILPYINNNLQEILRLVGTANITTRVMFHLIQKVRETVDETQQPVTCRDITPGKLSAWVVLISQWPYRLTWLTQEIEDRNDAGHPFSGGTGLVEVYKDAESYLMVVPGWRKLIQLDCDPDKLREFLLAHSSWLNVAFLRYVLPLTVSLDRSLKRVVSWTSVELGIKSYRTHSEKSLLNMNVDDVVAMLRSCCHGSSKLDEYAQICAEQNINGIVLLEGELHLLKECLGMTLGDWTLFSYSLVRLRNAHQFKYAL